MASVTDEMKEQLAQLSISDRTELARFLLETLDEGSEAEAATLWHAELERRSVEIRDGCVSGELAASVLARLNQRVR